MKSIVVFAAVASTLLLHTASAIGFHNSMRAGDASRGDSGSSAGDGSNNAKSADDGTCNPPAPIQGELERPSMWRYNDNLHGPHRGCNTAGVSDKPWLMLGSYRLGGVENVHWKYKSTVFATDCLNSYTIYESDGTTFVMNVTDTYTTYDSDQEWCALAVYRPGGAEGKQWAYCDCDTTSSA